MIFKYSTNLKIYALSPSFCVDPEKGLLIYEKKEGLLDEDPLCGE